MKKANTALAALCVAAAPLLAQEAETPAENPAVITLPDPGKSGGKPLMEALANRKTTRAFAETEIPMETLSSLLWAGFGVNRDDGKRTAPTAMNNQDTSIYVLTANGAFLYDAKANTLETRSTGDARAEVVTQAWGKNAPLVLLYAQTLKDAPNQRMDFFGGMHAGAIYQNVGLFCASEGLANVVVATFNNEAAAKALNLPENQRILVGHIIGRPQAQ